MGHFLLLHILSNKYPRQDIWRSTYLMFWFTWLLVACKLTRDCCLLSVDIN